MNKYEKTVTYTIKPDRIGGVNEMVLTFHGDAPRVGSDYKIHHWNDSVDEVIGRLERMVVALRDFQKQVAP